MSGKPETGPMLRPVPTVGDRRDGRDPPEHSGRDRNTQENVSALKKLINLRKQTPHFFFFLHRMKTKKFLYILKNSIQEKCLFIFTCFKSKSLRGIGGNS